MVESEKRGGEGQTAPKILFSTSEKRFFIYITLWKQVICDLCPAGGGWHGTKNQNSLKNLQHFGLKRYFGKNFTILHRRFRIFITNHFSGSRITSSQRTRPLVGTPWTVRRTTIPSARISILWKTARYHCPFVGPRV